MANSENTFRKEAHQPGIMVFRKVAWTYVLIVVSLVAWVQGLEAQTADLTKLSLEELLNIEVTSAAKKEQKLAEVAAAIYVITQEDIRRSGATSIPEALRMAPGLSVARIDSNKWSISARGFNGSFSNKLLVSIDGRSVYTPLFSGVFWDVQDTLLEDIERIEVIRGPAGALWGANAVNGVINIITKSANDTQGGLFTAGGGSHERGFGSLRYGGMLGNDVHFRVYGKYFNRDDYAGALGISASDGWHMARGGFRVDSNVGQNDFLTVQGEYYDGKVGTKVTTTALTPPFARLVSEDSPLAGGHLLGMWKRTLSHTSEVKVQLYYDRTERSSPVTKESRDTFDLETQHRFGFSQGHEMTWGLGYRFTTGKVKDNFTVTLNPMSRGDHLFNAFFQNDFTLVENRLRMTIGSKFEHNDYSGFEVQPNVRVWWTPHEKHTIWGAISRAARTPSRFEHDVRANLSAAAGPSVTCPVALPCVTSLFGNSSFESEHLIAYELGYRSQPTHRFSLDVATFYHVYHHLRTIEPGSPFLEATPAPLHLVIPTRPSNQMDGESYGIEVSTQWTLTNYWKVALGYTFFKLHLHPDKSSLSLTAKDGAGDSPRNQFNFRSYLDLPYNLKFDTVIYYVDRLPNQKVPAYTRADLRLGYSPFGNLDLSIGVQNLFDQRHREFGSSFLVHPTNIERSVYGKLTWRF